MYIYKLIYTGIYTCIPVYILYYTVHVYSIFWIQITIIHKYYIYTVGEEDKWVSLTCARKWYLWSRQEHGPREQHLVEVFESTSSFYINKKKKKKKKVKKEKTLRRSWEHTQHVFLLKNWVVCVFASFAGGGNLSEISSDSGCHNEQSTAENNTMGFLCSELARLLSLSLFFFFAWLTHNDSLWLV